jgi:hypothetical protein
VYYLHYLQYYYYIYVPILLNCNVESTVVIKLPLNRKSPPIQRYASRLRASTKDDYLRHIRTAVAVYIGILQQTSN